MRTEQGKNKRGRKVEKPRKVKDLPTKGAARGEALQVKGGGGSTKIPVDPTRMSRKS